MELGPRQRCLVTIARLRDDDAAPQIVPCGFDQTRWRIGIRRRSSSDKVRGCATFPPTCSVADWAHAGGAHSSTAKATLASRTGLRLPVRGMPCRSTSIGKSEPRRATCHKDHWVKRL